MKRMSGVDAAFLYGETPAWHMHVSAVLLVDPSETPGGFSADRFEQRIASRLPLVPQFRWKLVEVPLSARLNARARVALAASKSPASACARARLRRISDSVGASFWT